MMRRFWIYFFITFTVHALFLGVSWQMRDKNQYATSPFKDSVLKLQVGVKKLMTMSSRAIPKTKKPAPQETNKETKAESETQVASQNTPAKASASELQDLREQYKAQLRAKIEEHKYFPPAARRLGQQGTVIVAFTLLEDGHIINVRIDSPSRYESLNASALDAVRKVHVFLPIPRELGETRMDLKIPLIFRI